MGNIDLEIIVLGLVGLLLAIKLFSAFRHQRTVPTTGEGWLEEIKRDRQ